MFSPNWTSASTGSSSRELKRLARAFDEADAVVVGAGAGLSTAAGFAYTGPRFERHFAEFRARYGITDMYAGGFYPFETPGQLWAWWSRAILVNRYDCGVGEPYRALVRLLAGRDCFVLTTNVDHQFQLAGFDKRRLFYTQGDYGLFQCARPCHDKTYDNEESVRAMAAALDAHIAEQRAAGVPDERLDLSIPDDLLPRCPVCGGPMTTNLRVDDAFVQDEGWHAAARRYEDFLRRHEGARVLFLELGVGFNTPGIVKYPFWQMTAANPRATYACVNPGEALCPSVLEHQAILVDAGADKAIAALERACVTAG